MDVDSVLRRFHEPDELREFELGRFEVVEVAGTTIGRATYLPGWRWSTHVGAALGQRFCTVPHLGVVLSGTATAAYEDGAVDELTPGTVFHIPTRPHDSWVVGDEPYVSLHLRGAGSYAT